MLSEAAVDTFTVKFSLARRNPPLPTRALAGRGKVNNRHKITIRQSKRLKDILLPPWIAQW